MAKKTKIPTKVIKYLEKAGIDHDILEHKTVYTAIDAAATMKKKLNEIAKSLLVKADRDYYLVLLPADNDIDFEKLKKAIGKKHQKEIKTIKIPGEKMVEGALRVKAGGVTAFGKMHKLAMVADKKFAKLKKAVFASGSNNHSIEMAIKDFFTLEEPLVDNISVKKKIKPAKKQVETKKSVKPKLKPKTKKVVKKKVKK